MDRLELVERRVPERVGKAVQIADHIGAAGRVAVDANRAREFVDAAANVEYSHKL